MISKVANKMAVWLIDRSPNARYSVASIEFILIIILNVLLTIFVSLPIALILGHFIETAVILFASFILRQYSGGYHMSESWRCIVTTVILSNVIPYIHISTITVLILTGLSGVLAAIFAPSRIELDTVIPKSEYKYLRILSVQIICFNFLFLSPVLAITFALQSISLIRLPHKEVITLG